MITQVRPPTSGPPPATDSASSPVGRAAGTGLTVSRTACLWTLALLWIAIFFSSLFAPPVFDDADATHANAARHILTSGDWVTLKVNGIRYLEKAPLPYWLDAISFRLFGFNTFAAHLPEAIAVFLLALLGYLWAEQAYSRHAALYTGIFVLTSAGVFLFTRVFIPEVWLSLFLCAALYCLLKSLGEPTEPGATPLSPLPARAGYSRKRANRLRSVYVYALWIGLALAVLTKGFVALVFLFGAAAVYLAFTGEYRQWRALKPLTGSLLFLAIAAPWHILAGLRNKGGINGHGFFWFYFINEHVLRFLGKRYPVDYNKLPGYLFWSLHLVWLFPWALFAPLALLAGWRLFKQREKRTVWGFQNSTTLLLVLFSALVLGFFSLSTNQEYYTFPAYLPLLMLIAAAVVRAEGTSATDRSSKRWILFAHAALTIAGAAVAITLFLGLWSSRKLPFIPDIGSLLAHRGIGDYTLSMSHMFDLTGPSFAALRLPATLAAFAFAIGPAIGWRLRVQRRHLAATFAIALTSTIFLIAAHIALIRFSPMMSSENLAEKIEQLRGDHAIANNTQILIYGDQSYGSSIPFYLGEQVSLVEGRSSSMLFGSTFRDAPKIFLTDADLLSIWGIGPRKLLFVPLERRDDADKVLGSREIVLAETSGKLLITDRALDSR